MNTRDPVFLKDLNGVLTCPLCLGYYVDATTLVDCMHSFCKSCILKHFENSKIICPTCNTACKKKENFSYYKQDMQLQTLVYKIVPGLYAKEIQRREDFYRTAGVRASSSCSDDSVIGDNMQEHEEWIHTIGDENQFLSPDDSISLSLEYYQQHLDNGSSSQKTPDRRKSENTDSSNSNINNSSSTNNINNNNSDYSEKNTENVDNDAVVGDKNLDSDIDNNKVQSDKSDPDYKSKEEKIKDRRYLQCPAAVSMTHLQKFIRMKYALSTEHKVDIIYNGEVLPPSFTLMDVAYTFKWKRAKPMRFFYRIFTPMKIRPIRIINTSSSGPKQLQIVQVNINPIQEVKTAEPQKKSPPREICNLTAIENEENSKEKERLMAELQLQSKAKMMEQLEASNTSEKNVQNSRYGKTYERSHDVPNIVTNEKRKREIEESEKDDTDKRKKFHADTVSSKNEKKRRDVEEDSSYVFEYEEQDKEELKRFAEKRDREWQMIKHSDDEPRPYKKRKKNKHSKGDKRKLHAEITSELSNKQESIKLKVKLTPHNGHKHKHHKTQTEGGIVEMSSKEKLRQMRQIRHKMINIEEKVQKVMEDKPKEDKSRAEYTITLAKTTTETQTRTSEVKMKSSETQTKSSETQTVSKDEPKEKSEALFSGKTLRSDFISKTTASKELCNKQAIVQTERLEQIEKLLPKSSPRMVYTKSEKTKAESTEKKKVAQSTKSLQQQISLLQQQCSVKTAEIKVEPSKQDKKVAFSADKHHLLNSQYPSGFTVSKVEAGAKKKEVEDPNQDKRPSLEITLINPPSTEATSTVTAPKQSPSTTTKRPLPATIPLERIKSIKGITTLSGISIIPKVPEKCDNIGALDLSKPNRSAETKVELNKNGLNPNGNGLKPISTASADKGPLSNLQMLSKVATEHPNINKPINVQNKQRAQMPSLQNIKVPNLPNQTNKPTNLAKLPKLNEINKGQFRMANSPRTMRPNQNQSIRNIPNPSLLVRQQNQNRMNSLSLAASSNEKDVKNPAPTALSENDKKKKEEQKMVEKCDIKVSKT